jgi:hypothetical protein
VSDIEYVRAGSHVWLFVRVVREAASSLPPFVVAYLPGKTGVFTAPQC